MNSSELTHAPFSEVFNPHEHRLDFPKNTYSDFTPLKFKIISDLNPGRKYAFDVTEPTYIEQSTGELEITARAPVIVIGCTSKITLDSFAPVIVTGSTGGLTARLRHTALVSGGTNANTIIAAPYMELRAEKVSTYSGRYNHCGPITQIPAGETKAYVYFEGGPGKLDFSYDASLGLHLPDKK